MKVVPNWVILIALVITFGAAFGGTYMLGRSAGVKSVKLDHAEEKITALEDAAKRERELRITLETERGRLRDVSGKLQEALQGKEVVYVDVVKTVTKEIEKPVYQQCVLPASGVSVISESAARFNATRRTED